VTANNPGRIDYGEALRGLATSQTWCKAAKTLVDIGDRRALIPLLEAYETPIEGGKRCLLDAMEALGATAAAAELFNGDLRQRSQALRLMELFASDRHIPLLLTAVSDPAEGVRSQARRALANQERTGPWEAAMIQLLDNNDPKTRAMAIEALRERKSAAARHALESHGA
jgi:HEAT repeat protein